MNISNAMLEFDEFTNNEQINFLVNILPTVDIMIAFLEVRGLNVEYAVIKESARLWGIMISAIDEKLTENQQTKILQLKERAIIHATTSYDEYTKTDMKRANKTDTSSISQSSREENAVFLSQGKEDPVDYGPPQLIDEEDIALLKLDDYNREMCGSSSLDTDQDEARKTKLRWFSSHLL